jgi:putative membrane protein
MFNYHTLIATIVYAFVGIGLLLLSYFILERLTPERTWREVAEQKNVAVAIVLAAYIIALGLIISAAIHG